MGNQVTLDQIVSLSKRRGFVFPGSEIYGGLANTWDYGPIGVELKRNVKEAWWKATVRMRNDVVGLDSSILLNVKTWEASGHLAGFSDPLVECKSCQARFRSDEVTDSGCPNCGGELTKERQFNLMLKTFLGPVEETASTVYMRPETAQGIFINFLNVLNSSRKKLPFGIAQIGKAFRNEITPGNFVFRTREFEQMELEFFVQPGTDEAWHKEWITERLNWYIKLGINPENLRLREHSVDELAHYSKATTDIEYRFPWGWAELEGIANRGDFDLSQHSSHSRTPLTFFDEATKSHITPYVIEPSGGVDRATLAFLVDAYDEEILDRNSAGAGKGEGRTVLRLHPSLAPIQIGILPLSRNEKVVPIARMIEQELLAFGSWTVEYDDTQSIGKRYRRFDEIGTPYCLTIDFDSPVDNEVTLRDRDTLEQVRIPIATIKQVITEKFRL